jgi:hypothetical protein
MMRSYPPFTHADDEASKRPVPSNPAMSCAHRATVLTTPHLPPPGRRLPEGMAR